MEQEPQEAEETAEVMFHFTAAQVAQRVLDVYNEPPSKGRIGQFIECFGDGVCLRRWEPKLHHKDALAASAGDLRTQIAKRMTQTKGKCKVTKRMFIETDLSKPVGRDADAGSPTFALDFFAKKNCPWRRVGMNQSGVVVMYMVRLHRA